MSGYLQAIAARGAGLLPTQTPVLPVRGHVFSEPYLPTLLVTPALLPAVPLDPLLDSSWLDPLRQHEPIFTTTDSERTHETQSRMRPLAQADDQQGGLLSRRHVGQERPAESQEVSGASHQPPAPLGPASIAARAAGAVAGGAAPTSPRSAVGQPEPPPVTSPALAPVIAATAAMATPAPTDTAMEAAAAPARPPPMAPVARRAVPDRQAFTGATPIPRPEVRVSIGRIDVHVELPAPAVTQPPIAEPESFAALLLPRSGHRLPL